MFFTTFWYRQLYLYLVVSIAYVLMYLLLFTSLPYNAMLSRPHSFRIVTKTEDRYLIQANTTVSHETALRLIGSKYLGTKVTLLSRVDCICSSSCCI